MLHCVCTCVCVKELSGGSMTFRPEINRRSVVLAEARLQQAPGVAALPASERLYRNPTSPGRARRSVLTLAACTTQHFVSSLSQTT